MAFVYLNGRIVREEDASLSIWDRGFLYGDGLFETLRACGTTICFLSRHLRRLKSSCQSLDLRFPDTLEYEKIILSLLEINNIQGKAAIRMTLTRGEHTGSLTLSSPNDPTMLITVRPYEGTSDEAWEKGLALGIEGDLRQNPSGLLCQHKSLNYLPYLLARDRASGKGFDDAILANPSDEVCECTSANIFFFRKGRLETPALSCGLLPGVIREALMECAHLNGTGIEEVRIQPFDLYESEEVFVTNSLLEIMPVGRIEDRIFVQRKKTRALQQQFFAYRDSISKGTI